MVVIGAGLGWLVRSAQIQHEASAAITRAGGSVTYVWRWNSRITFLGGPPFLPEWLVDRIGIDYCGHVTDASLSSSSTTSVAVLEQVGRLGQLDRLILHQSSISDVQLVYLKGLKSLSSLDLSDTQITDAGLAQLQGADEPLVSRPHRHSSHRCRAGSFDRDVEPFVPQPQGHTRHRCRARANEGT